MTIGRSSNGYRWEHFENKTSREVKLRFADSSHKWGHRAFALFYTCRPRMSCVKGKKMGAER